MARFSLLWSLLQQIMLWSGWEVSLLWEDHGSYDLAQWELKVLGKIRLTGRGNS